MWLDTATVVEKKPDESVAKPARQFGHAMQI